MPQIDNLIKKRKGGKFNKRSYRPWDLSGQGATEEEQQAAPTSTFKSKNDSSSDTIDNSLDNKRITIGEHLDNKRITIGEHLGNLLDNKFDPASVSNRLKLLSGVQKDILHFVLDLCLVKDAEETGPIGTNTLSQFIGKSYGTTKTSISRLVDKGFLKRLPGKTSKGGYINLKLPADVKLILLDARNNKKANISPMQLIKTIREQLGNNLDNKLPISSSINNINNTTNKLEESWESINFESLREIGFSKTQLKQLYTNSLNEPEVIQESINHFAFGLKHNPKIKKYNDPLNVLMGVLRKGQAWIEQKYQSPQEIAQRELLQRKKAERERVQKLEEEAYLIAFEEWKDTLSSSDMERIAPTRKRGGDIIPAKVKLSLHFKEHIWPSRKKDYFF